MPDDYGNGYLADQCGYDDEMEMLEKATFDSVADGVCTICGYISRVEPDCGDGWCEECEKNTVKSCLVIAGLL